jgi:hypothetical protein
MLLCAALHPASEGATGLDALTGAVPVASDAESKHAVVAAMGRILCIRISSLVFWPAHHRPWTT